MESPASYLIDAISLKEMLYNPKLVPMGFEEEEDNNDEDTEFEEVSHSLLNKHDPLGIQAQR